MVEVLRQYALADTRGVCDDSPTNAGDIAFHLRDNHHHGARCDTQNFLVRMRVAAVEAFLGNITSRARMNPDVRMAAGG